MRRERLFFLTIALAAGILFAAAGLVRAADVPDTKNVQKCLEKCADKVKDCNVKCLMDQDCMKKCAEKLNDCKGDCEKAGKDAQDAVKGADKGDKDKKAESREKDGDKKGGDKEVHSRTKDGDKKGGDKEVHSRTKEGDKSEGAGSKFNIESQKDEPAGVMKEAQSRAKDEADHKICLSKSCARQCISLEADCKINCNHEPKCWAACQDKGGDCLDLCAR